MLLGLILVILHINIIYLHPFGCFMDAYQYALMKETLERIQKMVTEWRNDTDSRRGDGDYAMYEIEGILDEAGFHE